MVFLLTSPAFTDGEFIPVRYTCDGENISPPLQWANAPSETKSFILVCSDPDAPVGVWYHWAIFNLPASTTALPEALANKTRVDGACQAINDFRYVGYGGPCPPRGHGVHHYRFELTAASIPALPLDDPCDCRAVEMAAEWYRIASAIIVGTYSRQ